MKREDIDVMEAKARAALEAIPEDLRAVRWTVGNTATGSNADLLAIDLLYPDDPDCGHMLVEDTTDVLSRPTAEHIAASDPHAVLALIAELRRVEQERDLLAEVSAFRKKIDDAVMHALTNSTDKVPYEETPESTVPSNDGAVLVVEEVHLDEICGPGSAERAEAYRKQAQAKRLVAALAPVRDTLRDLQRPAWDEAVGVAFGFNLHVTLAQARELAAACDEVDPEPPLRNAD